MLTEAGHRTGSGGADCRTALLLTSTHTCSTSLYTHSHHKALSTVHGEKSFLTDAATAKGHKQESPDSKCFGTILIMPTCWNHFESFTSTLNISRVRNVLTGRHAEWQSQLLTAKEDFKCVHQDELIAQLKPNFLCIPIHQSCFNHRKDGALKL